MPSVIPAPNLLEQIEGVEAGLRKVYTIGRVGQYGFLVVAAAQIISQSGLLPQPPAGSAWARIMPAVRVASLIGLPLFLLLFTWSKFWLRQSREPFRYTCTIEPFTPMPQSPKVRQMEWVDHDLAELLSQRIERIRFVERGKTPEAGQKDESHIQIGGTYVVRERDDLRSDAAGERYFVLEILPDAAIGRDKGRKLAYAVSYPPDPVSSPLKVAPGATADAAGEVELKHSEYKSLLEWVYSSVATEIYRQIKLDVAKKIELMPTRYLRAVALYHEAEDYARSNTLYDYEEASALYERSARLFDPNLAPLPASRLLRFCSTLARTGRRSVRRRLRACSPLVPRLARRDTLCARALIGYSNMLLFRRVLASITGQRVNLAFEAQWCVRDALTRLGELTEDAAGWRAAFFDGHVSLALAFEQAGRREDAERELKLAASAHPDRDRDIRFQLARSNLARREKLAYRQLAALAPRWEIVLWEVAYRAERHWRMLPDFEESLANIPLDEYKRVLQLNPGNIGAWANSGYLCWLRERGQEAEGHFRAGRNYKLIKQETYIAELDYGLARIAAEQGELLKAFCSLDIAVSELIASSDYDIGDFRDYYFGQTANDALLRRFERYRETVETHLCDDAKTKGVPVRVLNSVYSFVLNDYGECCLACYARTGDPRRIERAEEAFDLASHFDPENPLALYNLRQMRVRELPKPGRRSQTELEEHIEALTAQLAAAQQEQSRNVVPSFGALQHQSAEHAPEQALQEAASGPAAAQSRPQRKRAPARTVPHAGLPDGRDSALEQEIASTQKSLDEAKAQRETARREIEEAKRYDDKIAELYPYWTLAMLRRAQKIAWQAFLGQSDAEQARRAFERASGPAQVEAERRKAELDRKAKGLADAARQNILNIQALVPHQWLWKADAEFNWDAVSDRDPLNERRWEKQFNNIQISALVTYADTLRLNARDRDKAAALLELVVNTFRPDDVIMLRGLRDLKADGDGTQHSPYDLQIRKISNQQRADDPFSYSNLLSVSEHPFTDDEKSRILQDASSHPGLSGPLYRWLGLRHQAIARAAMRKKALLTTVAETLRRVSELTQPGAERRVTTEPFAGRVFDEALQEVDRIWKKEMEGNGIDERELDRLRRQVDSVLMKLNSILDAGGNSAEGDGVAQSSGKCDGQLRDLIDLYSATEKRCAEGALEAYTRAAPASDDPRLLWAVAQELAQQGRLEETLQANRQGARIDGERHPVSTGGDGFREAAGALRHAEPANYSSQFRKFLELWRRPPVQAHTPLEYLRRECALLGTLGHLDSNAGPALELKKLESRWRTALVREAEQLFADSGTRSLFRKWLRAEVRAHAGDRAELADCRMAEIALASRDRRAPEGRSPVVAVAKSLKMLPAVTPIAIEISADLVGDEDGPWVKRMIDSLFPEMRERIERDCGIHLPGVRMRANETDMPKDSFLIMIDEVPIVMGRVERERVFAFSPTRDPVEEYWPPSDGAWVDAEKQWAHPGRMTLEVLDHLEYVVRHLEAVLRPRLDGFLGLEETGRLLESWRESGLTGDAAAHLDVLLRDPELLRRTTRQLRELVQERVPLTDPSRIANGLLEAHRFADSAERRRVLRNSVRDHLWGNGDRYVYLRLSEGIEKLLEPDASRSGRLSITPENLYYFLSAARTELDSPKNAVAVVTRGERVRQVTRYLLREEWPHVPVLAEDELRKAPVFAGEITLE
jgi:hypothetical protein